ncbi:alpha-(1,3)-fucosyltransferase 4-like [Hypomesus transpacificus]|uniref:alpha-(1,3)-fucosyltransferase 4-like n=1 Tax=Hypomesus transpacificus TaxID=137520 RepID=UPI001F07924B|nr:alpha-(1,3)-fucosyltransferase 4-like [Hypomesus transpacificus]XP_046892379.1 alpha-(1,3)-fucosyltransferase 4-like [Hypomesus transpacificus]
MEVMTRWRTAGRFSVNRFSKSHIIYRRKQCQVLILRSSCSLMCLYVLGGVMFLLGVGLCVFNLRKASTGNARATAMLVIWTHPFGHIRKLPDCEARYGVSGCTLTDNRLAYPSADAVIFHHREIATNVSAIPLDPRPRDQKWIWMNFESPSHTRNLKRFEGMFNLTMSYRADSDIFLPYGYLVSRHSTHGHPLHVPSSPHPRPCLLAWVISNWAESQARVAFYRQLSRYVRVDVFGRAGLALPGDSLVRTVARYQFYLALENSKHTDYITEKVWNALRAGAIPIVLGPTRENYERFLPAESFIHVDDFASVRGLAQYLRLLWRSPAHLERHLSWRRSYSMHQPAFWAEHFCTVCHVVMKARGRTSTVEGLARWFQS